VDDLLFFFLGFYIFEEGEYTFINADQFAANGHRRIYKTCCTAITKVLEKDVKINNYDSIYWDKIVDSKGHKYEFKKFSNNCIDLINDHKQEAERIANEMAGIIVRMRNEFDN